MEAEELEEWDDWIDKTDGVITAARALLVAALEDNEWWDVIDNLKGPLEALNEALKRMDKV